MTLKDIRTPGHKFPSSDSFGSPEPESPTIEELMKSALTDEPVMKENAVIIDFKRLVKDICEYSMFNDNLLTRNDRN